MSRQIGIYRDGKFIWFDKDKLPPPKPRAFNIITDSIDPVRHPATREMYNSKSALRQSYKEMGLVELGNDIQPQREISPRIEDVEKIIGETIMEGGGWDESKELGDWIDGK